MSLSFGLLFQDGFDFSGSFAFLHGAGGITGGSRGHLQQPLRNAGGEIKSVSSGQRGWLFE